MMATESTWPWVVNISLTSPSVNSCWRFPTYILKNSSCWSPRFGGFPMVESALHVIVGIQWCDGDFEFQLS